MKLRVCCLVFVMLVLNVSGLCCADEGVAVMSSSCDPSSGVLWRLETLPSASSGVAFVNEAATLDIALENHTVSDQDVRLTVATTTDLGQRSSEIIEINAPGCGTANVSVQLPTNESGYQLLETFLEVDGQMVAEATTALAVVSEMPNYQQLDPDSYFGLCEATDNDAADRLGCKFIRGGIGWRYMEPTPGDYSNLDLAVENLRNIRDQHGMGIMITLDPSAPAWAEWHVPENPKLADIPAPEYMQNWHDFVFQFVSRLGGTISGLDIQNEPNLHYWFGMDWSFQEGVDIYVRLVKLAYQAARAANPDLTFCGLGVGGDYDMGYQYTRAVLDQGVQLDVFTGHPYAPSRYFNTDLHPRMPGEWLSDACKRGLDIMEEHGNPRRMWVGELGWAMDPEAPELGELSLDFAACIAQALITCKSVRGVEHHFHFPQRPYVEGGRCYGMFRGAPNGRPMYPLPAACAYAACARQLHHSEIVRALVLGETLSAFRFDRVEDGLTVITLWSRNQPLRLEADMPVSVNVVNCFGREYSSDRLDIEIGHLPIFITAPLAQAEEFTNAIEAATISATEPVSIAQLSLDSSSQINISLMNNLNRPIDVFLSYQSENLAYTLEPGLAALQLPLDPPIIAAPGNSVAINLNAENSSIVNQLSLDLLSIKYLDSMSIDGELTETAWLDEISLNTRDYVLPPDPTIPWDGSEDLSMTAWIGWDEQCLYFAAQVTDDIHNAPHDGPSDFFMSDSIQIALDLQNNSLDAFDADDREIGLVLSASIGPAAYITYPLPMQPISCEVASHREGSTTTYELAVPWASLGLDSVYAGKVIALDFIANENDGNSRCCWIGLTPGIGLCKNPQAYRRFILESE